MEEIFGFGRKIRVGGQLLPLKKTTKFEGILAQGSNIILF